TVRARLCVHTVFHVLCGWAYFCLLALPEGWFHGQACPYSCTRYDSSSPGRATGERVYVPVDRHQCWTRRGDPRPGAPDLLARRGGDQDADEGYAGRRVGRPEGVPRAAEEDAGPSGAGQHHRDDGQQPEDSGDGQRVVPCVLYSPQAGREGIRDHG